MKVDGMLLLGTIILQYWIPQIYITMKSVLSRLRHRLCIARAGWVVFITYRDSPQ